jgi:hypothetical protein
MGYPLIRSWSPKKRQSSGGGGMFLHLVGAFAVAVGVVIFKDAPTSVQETEGLIPIGFGSVVFGLGSVQGAVRDFPSRLQTLQRPYERA